MTPFRAEIVNFDFTLIDSILKQLFEFKNSIGKWGKIIFQKKNMTISLIAEISFFDDPVCKN